MDRTCIARNAVHDIHNRWRTIPFERRIECTDICCCCRAVSFACAAALQFKCQIPCCVENDQRVVVVAAECENFEVLCQITQTDFRRVTWGACT